MCRERPLLKLCFTVCNLLSELFYFLKFFPAFLRVSHKAYYQDSMTLFLGEDFHILLPSLGVEVTFRNKSGDVVLMRGSTVISSRAKVNSQNSHLVVEAVDEGDEGLYTVKNPEDPDNVKRIFLWVRDCVNELTFKYGENFHVPVSGVNRPITLEYRHSSVEANQTSRPALVVWTAAGTPTKPYQGRLSVSERDVTLSAVTGGDEGSYTVRDNRGVIQRKVCLKVKEHQKFVTLPYGKRLKINLILNSSVVTLNYSLNSDPTPHQLLNKGEFTSVTGDIAKLGLEERFSVEGSYAFLDQVTGADAGQFKIMDLQGFTVSTVHLQVEPYRLETLYVAIIALLGLLVFLLLVCLLSCLIKVKKRAKRSAALEKIAQNAGKEDEGEAFRQVREPSVQCTLQCSDNNDVYSGPVISLVSSTCAHLHRWSRTSQNSVKNPSILRLTLQRNLRALRWTLR
uniref:Si:dkeyp-77h1.4 n=1 Tax=Acanthochromis polyacanthus TaxID=80966 RepID=A0A3Q1G0X2_9TELE